jgi:hypothetical protein
VRDALRTAVARWRGVDGSRLFIVRTHMSASEAAAWERALHELDLKPTSVAVGSDPLLVVKG